MVSIAQRECGEDDEHVAHGLEVVTTVRDGRGWGKEREATARGVAQVAAKVPIRLFLGFETYVALFQKGITSR